MGQTLFVLFCDKLTKTLVMHIRWLRPDTSEKGKVYECNGFFVLFFKDGWMRKAGKSRWRSYLQNDFVFPGGEEFNDSR